MTRRKLLKTLGILFVVALCLITAALAYTVPSDTIVYITPTGSKYHREDCSHTTTVRGMTIEQAERKGYGACSRCDPDVKTGVYGSSSQKSSSSSKSSGSSYSAPTPTPTPTPAPVVKKPITFGRILGWLAIGLFVVYPIVISIVFGIYEFVGVFLKDSGAKRK